MEKFYPQCAEGTHRAEGASLLPEGKNITSSLLKMLLVKAEGNHKSFVDLSHCAVGQIADFVF